MTYSGKEWVEECSSRSVIHKPKKNSFTLLPWLPGAVLPKNPSFFPQMASKMLSP